MLTLNLGARPVVKLPASTFPNRADLYVCDKCGRDITKHFRPRQSHSWGPMGPESFVCFCGQRYLTGAREWDHFSERERSRRVGQTLGFGILLSAIFSIPGFLAYLALRLVFGLREGALVAGLAITALPFSLTQMGF